MLGSEIQAAATQAAMNLGYPALRELQLEVVTAFVTGHDVLAVLPTAYGKSLCYAILPGVFDVLYRCEEPTIVCVAQYRWHSLIVLSIFHIHYISFSAHSTRTSLVYVSPQTTL